MSYYDGTKLMSLKDINGLDPELYLCTTNRNAGKTTFFSRWMVKRFLTYSEKFMLVYRFNYELDDCSEKFFKDIGILFFPDMVMTSKRRASGSYHELFLDDESCGYAVALNCCDQLKKYGHMFQDVQRMLFDEFQSETNHYCTDEITKLQSVHTTVARGRGEQVRHVPVYMLSNTVSIINPYYVTFDIINRLQADTKFLKGDGFVLEQGFIQSAADAQKKSGFMRAFKNTKYSAYAAENVYLNDNSAFIEKPTGEGRYIVTLKYNERNYGIREYSNLGVIYCDNHADQTFPRRISVTTEDHNINYVMLKRNNAFLTYLRQLFEVGSFRFKDLQCKEAVLKALSY